MTFRVRRRSDEEIAAMAAWLAPIFAANNWHYGIWEGSHIPTADEIADTLRRLQEPDLVGGYENVDCLSGRLRARADASTMRIEFYLELGVPTSPNDPYLLPMPRSFVEVLRS